MALIISLVSVVSCSHLDRWMGEAQQKRSFLVRPDWVMQSPLQDNLKFRKINRAKALITDKAVIQMNSIDGVVAYDKTSGKELWRLPVLNGVEASAAIVRERIFFGALDGQVYSVDIKSGQVEWTYPTRIENLAEPLLVEGTLYIQSGSNALFALDAATGKQLWIYTRQDPSALSIRGGSKPAYRNGTLYVGFSDGALVALIAKNGSVKWEKQLSKNKKFRDLDSDPLIEGDFIYVLGFDDAAYCLRAATGDLVWKHPKGGYGQGLLHKDKFYYASTEGELVALDKETGRPSWSYKLKTGLPTTPIYYKGMVVFGESAGDLVFLDATDGRRISHFTPGRGIMSTPVAEEKSHSVYFISNEANFYRVEAKWDYPLRIPYLR